MDRKFALKPKSRDRRSFDRLIARWYSRLFRPKVQSKLVLCLKKYPIKYPKIIQFYQNIFKSFRKFWFSIFISFFFSKFLNFQTFSFLQKNFINYQKNFKSFNFFILKPMKFYIANLNIKTDFSSKFNNISFIKN